MDDKTRRHCTASWSGAQKRKGGHFKIRVEVLDARFRRVARGDPARKGSALRALGSTAATVTRVTHPCGACPVETMYTAEEQTLNTKSIVPRRVVKMLRANQIRIVS